MKSVRSYALKKGLTVQAVGWQIRQGKLETKKIGGKTYIVEPDDNVKAGIEVDDVDIDTKLKREKLANMKADTLLKNERTLATKEKHRAEFCEGVLEALTTNSFINFKKSLVEAKMNKEQIAIIKKAIDKDLAQVESVLAEYLKTKQKEEAEEVNGNDESAE